MARVACLLLLSLGAASPAAAAWGSSKVDAAKPAEVAKALVTSTTDDKVSVVKREETYDSWHSQNMYWRGPPSCFGSPARPRCALRVRLAGAGRGAGTDPASRVQVQ